MNIDKIIEASNFVLSKCVDIETPEDCFFKIEHHLPLKTPWSEGGHINNPDNWDLSDEDLEKVQKSLEILSDYADKMCHRYTRYSNTKDENDVYTFGKEFLPFEEPILPHWVVFPHYPATTIGWRMGMGEEYAELYYVYCMKLNDEELKSNIMQYPYPNYFEFRNKQVNTDWRIKN